ncbi:hypothetical protein DT037_06925 [Pseudomonas fulva]|uniref:hypothetical protein n=1 Tax=Pseudomonas putida group TaxID=136845 RepID=UPI0015F6D6EE|nr:MULTISPECIES: hypothetical protein [Pseudomonas putida group]MBA5706809.1 hypothetical protein [Pseudomonas fulva]MBF8727786.1 hypothetical protein [Pseudomonas putida]
MSTHKIAVILDKLIEKTAAGELGWQSTERRDVYQVSFPHYSIRMQRIDKDFEEDFVVQIINKDGNILESFNDTEVKIFYSNAFSRMKELHSAARRKAMGVEDALDELLKELTKDDLDDIPF